MDEGLAKLLESKTELILQDFEQRNKDFNQLLRSLLFEIDNGNYGEIKEKLFELEEVHNKDKATLIKVAFLQGVSQSIMK